MYIQYNKHQHRLKERKTILAWRLKKRKKKIHLFCVKEGKSWRQLLNFDTTLSTWNIIPPVCGFLRQMDYSIAHHTDRIWDYQEDENKNHISIYKLVTEALARFSFHFCLLLNSTGWAAVASQDCGHGYLTDEWEKHQDHAAGSCPPNGIKMFQSFRWMRNFKKKKKRQKLTISFNDEWSDCNNRAYVNDCMGEETI